MKTVRVRIAVAVDAEGRWSAAGSRGDTMQEVAVEMLDANAPYALHWVEADVPLPEAQTIQGDVRAADA